LAAFLIAATLVSAIAAWTDWRTGLIPNWVTGGALLIGLVGHFGFGWFLQGFRTGLLELTLSIAGVVLCSIAPGLMYWKGAMGGGDLKLFAALGALCQPMLGIEIQMYAFVIAAILAPAQLAYQGRLGSVLANSAALLVNPLRKQEKRREVPMELMSWFRLGPAIFAGSAGALIAHGWPLLGAL
jgi:prepilin peptidase CpaA